MNGPEFRESVIRQLTELNTKMDTLVGAEGRVTHLERKMRRHERLIWLSAGALTSIVWIIREAWLWVVQNGAH